MAFRLGSGDSEGDLELLCDINTTPLIDVMLVLLIMLIITIPVQLHAIDLSVARGEPPPEVVRPPPVRIDVDAESRIRWAGEVVDSAAGLEARLAALAAQSPPAELQLRPDARARYAVVAQVLAATRRHGLRQVAMLGGEQFE